ncbi:MAG: UDP-glucose--hexose-1-phosphate uridylyltransferase [Lachnospiraceae bacterium]|nr:UDP-glucose--hexose-1-phosphate uridylyltransferase [Lachnospiraceae bacterium]
MNLQEEIVKLTEYGVRKRLIHETDRVYTINRYLELFGLDSLEVGERRMEELCRTEIDLHQVLKNLTDQAFVLGLLENDGITQRDLFDTKLMGILTPRPSEVIGQFEQCYGESPENATEFFYGFSLNTNYIRADRIKKDRRWKVSSPYGEIDITINLSKPEKDPKAIAAARNMTGSQYPACQLCIENEGYAGRVNHPARQNHRIIPLEIQGKRWGFQYSPYVYYNEHCIVLSAKHEPMKIDRATFEKLFDFVDQFPHYFLGSNADLPIVGGSILSHDHFQGGHYTFAMERAQIEKMFAIPGFTDVEAGIVHWPLSVIRLRGKNKSSVIDLADHILDKWRGYTDEEAFIFAETDGEPHNTITPIARKKGEVYELDLTLRNNITTEEHPLGVYHPHAEYHHIKKENIGLIEVMGLAVLPARLNREMELLAECLVGKASMEAFPELEKHREWTAKITEKYGHICSENVDEILQEEIGAVFVKVLEDAGVYKCNPKGREYFARFMQSL